jgi:hypothetical protein
MGSEHTLRELLPRAAGGGSLRREKDIYIMDLRGGYDEMGVQMALLVRGIVDDYVTKYYRELPEKLISHSFVSHISRVLPPRIASALYGLFVRGSQSRLGPELRMFVESFYRTLDINPRAGVRAIFFADLLHYLAGRAFTPIAPPPACSGFFARGAATLGGKTIVGRNFDFYGRGIWNEHQTITVIRPRGQLAFLWVGSLGVPFGGFGINEAGIALMPHTNFTRDVTLRGRPLFQFVSEIFHTARSLDDVVEIVGRGTRCVGLSFLMVDTKAHDARAVGFSAHRMEVIEPKDDYLIRTNHYLTGEMKAVEVAPSAWSRHSNSRFMRLDQLIRDNYGSITPGLTVSFMSDTLDINEGRKRIVGDLIPASNNAMSVVLSPDDDAIHIAHGDYPVCHSDVFRGFRLSALFKGDAEVSMPDLDGGHQLNGDEKAALFHFEEAWSEYLDRGDSDRAVFHLRRAAEILPDEPIFHRLAGLILLKHGNFNAALIHLEVNAAPDYRCEKVRAESLLWGGRANDLVGNRERALDYYRKALEVDDPEMSPAAARGLKKPYSKSSLINVDLEFITGTPIVKYR